MKAGTELDMLVAQKLGLWYPGDKSGCPAYSTEISAAWQAVDAVRKSFGNGVSFELRWNLRGPHSPSWVDEEVHAFFALCVAPYNAAGHADTAALAICLAALNAVVPASLRSGEGLSLIHI